MIARAENTFVATGLFVNRSLRKLATMLQRETLGPVHVLPVVDLLDLVFWGGRDLMVTR